MTVIKQKMVLTRKEHFCHGCARKLPKGTKMEVITSAESGSIYSDYWCEVCTAYWNKHMNNGDEIGFGELISEDPSRWKKIQKTLFIFGTL